MQAHFRSHAYTCKYPVHDLRLQGVAEAESRRAADAAEAAYQKAFNKDVPADEAALDREFDRAFNVGQAAFREVAVGEDIAFL